MRLGATDRPATLVIGYGNELRGDDGLGRRLASAVSLKQWPGVRGIHLRQLIPELAPEIAAAERVIFADATQRMLPNGFALDALGPAVDHPAMTHVGGPGSLLRMAEKLYGRTPTAFMLTMAGVEFGFADRLSAEAESNLQRALQALETLIHA